MSKKLAKVLFANRLIKSDDEHSDSRESSCESEQNSHVPLKNFNLFFNPTITDKENKMTDQNADAEFKQHLSNQMNAIMQSITAMNAKQTQYDGMLAAINEKLNNNNTGNNTAYRQVPALPQQMDLFRIPDPIKSIPTYDGSRRQLSS